MKWKDGRTVAVVATGAIIFGFVGLPIRVLNDLGMGAMEIAMVRLGITTIGIAAIALLTDRSALRMDSAKDLVLLVMVGVSKFLTDIACLNAQISIELSLATLLQMTAPCYVMVFSRLLFGEGITVPRIVAVAVAFVGCVLVTGVLTGDIDNMDIFGLVCGILSGLFFSLYLVGCKVCSNHGHSTTTVIFYVFLVASLLTIPFTDLSCVGKMMMNADSIPYILLMVFVMTLIPYYTEMWGVGRLSPNVVTILAMLELVTACIVGFVFFDEVLSMMNILGMCLIMVSVMVIDIIPKGEVGSG